MAERRMISLKVIDTDSFLDMSISARYLYHELNARADDDGFISSVRKITNMVGATKGELDELIKHKFLISFDTGIIVITHWKMSNYIKKDRYKPTVYQQEKSMLSTLETGEYCLSDTSCIQNASKMDTQDRLGKDRLGKDKKVKGNTPSKTQKNKYGEYKHVILNKDQLKNLINDFGKIKVNKYIKNVDEYCQQSGKSYKDYNLTIRKWIDKDGEKHGINRDISSNYARDKGKTSGAKNYGEVI